MTLNGSREQAQRMLAEMRDLLERLQSGQMTKRQAERGQMMMKKLDELGDIVGQQQRLMDETFRQHRRQGQRGARAGEGTPDPNGRRGQKQGREPRMKYDFCCPLCKKVVEVTSTPKEIGTVVLACAPCGFVLMRRVYHPIAVHYRAGGFCGKIGPSECRDRIGPSECKEKIDARNDA